MICIARTFGAPETVPAGNVARSTSNGVTPSCSSPATSETRCVTCEKRSGSRKRSTFTVPGTHTRERSLRPRSTSITCSARSFSEASSRSASPSPRAVVPAIGLRLARVPSTLTCVSGDEPTSARSPSSSRKRYGDGLIRRERAVDRERRRGRRALGALREDDLERVAPPDVLLHARDATLVLGAVGRAHASRRRRRPARRRPGVPGERRGDRRPGRRAAPRPSRSRGRSGGRRRRRRSGSRARRAPRPAAARSARASRRGRSRGSRRPARRAPRPLRTRRAASPQPTNE